MNALAKRRRRKSPATVSPSKLSGALHAKLARATWKLLQVQEAEQPRVGGNESHHDLVVQCVRAARGVYPIAATFGKSWLPGNGFEAWVENWENGGTDAERALWHRMQDLREADEHGDGAVLVPVEIPIVLEYVSSNTALMASGIGHQPTASKGGVRFGPYPDRPASEVCAAYLQLCRRFVDDFLRDHAALI